MSLLNLLSLCVAIFLLSMRHAYRSSDYRLIVLSAGVFLLVALSPSRWWTGSPSSLYTRMFCRCLAIVVAFLFLRRFGMSLFDGGSLQFLLTHPPILASIAAASFLLLYGTGLNERAFRRLGFVTKPILSMFSSNSRAAAPRTSGDDFSSGAVQGADSQVPPVAESKSITVGNSLLWRVFCGLVGIVMLPAWWLGPEEFSSDPRSNVIAPLLGVACLIFAFFPRSAMAKRFLDELNAPAFGGKASDRSKAEQRGEAGKD